MINTGYQNQVQDFLETLHTTTGVKTETIFTVLTTLFVFGAGIITNWIISILKERRQRKNYQKTINLLLFNLSNVCKRQYKLTLKDLESFSLLDNKMMGIKQQVYTPLQFLNKMDYSLFIKYYVRSCNQRLKVKAVTKVFQIIGYSSIFESDNVEKLRFFLDHVKPMQETYIKNMLALESFGRGISALDVIDYDFKARLIEIFKEWEIKHTDNNFRNSFTNLISPLLRLLPEYSMEPASIQLSNLTTECHVMYSDMAHMNGLIAEHFKTFAIENKRLYKQLDIILRIFNYKQPHR